MKFPILLLLAMSLFASCAGKTEKNSCGKFRTGAFHIKPKNGVSAFSLVRTDSIQYEIDIKTGKTITYKINWTGECDYELELVESKKKEARMSRKQIFFDSLRNQPLYIRIIATADDYYVFEAKKQGILKIYGDTIWVGNTMDAFNK